jgi:hypothetical protein
LNTFSSDQSVKEKVFDLASASVEHDRRAGMAGEPAPCEAVRTAHAKLSF